jgi:hypothetical protein
MPHRRPVHNEGEHHDQHDQAEAQIELTANTFVHAHISNLTRPAKQPVRVSPSKKISNSTCAETQLCPAQRSRADE